MKNQWSIFAKFIIIPKFEHLFIHIKAFVFLLLEIDLKYSHSNEMTDIYRYLQSFCTCSICAQGQWRVKNIESLARYSQIIAGTVTCRIYACIGRLIHSYLYCTLGHYKLCWYARYRANMNDIYML